VICSSCAELAQKQAQSIPGYQLIRELGRGGMGVVYLALRQTDQTLVALKKVTPEAKGSKAQIERFLREADILRRLEHPHVVSFRDMGQAAGQIYFAMDYVAGQDAAQLLQQQGPLPVGRAVALACQLLEALEYAHSQGIVHRDIKPANVLLAQAEGREVVKLTDFGLARTYQASTLSGLTLKGDVGGTIAFMAPEQITNFRDAKPAVDQYAAAATLYNLLTNRYVYDLPAATHKQLLMVLQDAPVPIEARRDDLPQKLADAIQRALLREPGQRFPNVQALRQALLSYCG
jgi:serine/threonine-protein kinase